MTHLYVEFVGLPGVGKSTVVDGLRGLLRKDYQVVVTTEPPKLALIRRCEWPRLVKFVQLITYLRFERSARFLRALRRARVVLLSGKRQDFRRSRHGVLLLDEGPIVYLTNVGGYGPRWQSWASFLLPDDQSVRVLLVFLHLGDAERRQRLLGRGSQTEPEPEDGRREGKVGITHEQRTEGYTYWLNRFRERGVDCLQIDMDGLAVDEVARSIRDYIRDGRRGRDTD